jgi:hypothetical protein
MQKCKIKRKVIGEKEMKSMMAMPQLRPDTM